MAKAHKVLIRRCEEYDPDKIAAIVTEGMRELGVTPSGNILLKPNVVLAHPEVFPYAFTRKEFLDGVITATKELAKNDMLLKFLKAQFHSLVKKSSRYIHAKGCPLSVAQHVNYVSSMAKIKNPNFDPKLFVQANITYYQMRFHRFIARFAG